MKCKMTNIKEGKDDDAEQHNNNTTLITYTNIKEKLNK